MFRNLINNLSKGQKIGIIVIAQIIIVAILGTILSFCLAPRQYASIEENETEKEIDLPEEAKKLVSDSIWLLVRAYVPDLNKNDINDIAIRDGTYEETVNEDGSVNVNFIVDIDSLKQTYTVSTGWTENRDVIFDVTIDCPSQDLMKYPETICYGTYNNTYSLDLYLPYSVYPESGDGAPNYMINGDEANKTIDIMVSACDAEKYKKEAMDYLRSTPIKLDEYTINYEVNSVDIDCGA